ncbi:MAG: hypothetical protein B6I20_06925 [Bacteroidetes bacterium 4572_117]|nr:MAG: hypothetical protein B6I20_06925 [Bacteroidetes bacterium 4572_117]
MTERKNKKKVILGGVFLGAIPMLFLIYLLLGPVLSLLRKDMSAENMYVISNGVNVRLQAEKDALKMGRIDYGTKLLVYKIENEWAEVLVEGQKAYVSKDYIVDAKTFAMLEGLFGDERSKKRIKKTQYRLAIIRYLNEKGYKTPISEEYSDFFEDNDFEKEPYQVFSEPGKSKYNSMAFGDFDGDFVWDAAFILKNPDTEKKLLVILSFDKNDPLNKSKCIFDMELENPWSFIRKTTKGNSWYINKPDVEAEKKPRKEKIKISGISIGTNRNRNLNDPVKLLLYNGEEFEIHEQNK